MRLVFGRGNVAQPSLHYCNNNPGATWYGLSARDFADLPPADVG